MPEMEKIRRKPDPVFARDLDFLCKMQKIILVI